MRLRPAALALIAASTLALTLGCGPRPQARPANVLVVTFDTTRWDHMGYQQGKAGVTPMLDAMAQRGTTFGAALSAQPLTLPSHTSIFTGLYPPHHGVRNNGTYIVGEENETLAERLKAKGFQTHAVVSAFVLDSQFGLDQGFDTYDDDLSNGPKQKMFMFKEVPAARTALRGATWLNSEWDKTRPFFLWMHFFDPHANYEPPPDVAKRFPGDPYQGEIHYADRELGRIFKELEILGQLDNTLIVFTSDHGDSLGEHGEKTHGLFIYDSTTRVPLLFSGPGVPVGKAVDTVVRSVDITPTILDLLGMGVPDALDGQSLIPLWNGEETGDREAYIESMMPRLNFGWSELRALRTGAAKAIQAPRPELYDLKTDPGETINLRIAQGPDAGAPLFQRLEALTAEDPFTRGEQQQDALDPETQEKLIALGYLWDVPDPGETEGPLPDPKDRLLYYERFQLSQDLIRRQRFEEAAALITGLLKEDPGNILAKSSLAAALTQMGETERALAVYAELREAEPKRETAYLGAAKLLRKEGRFEEAEPLVRAVLEMQPENPEGAIALGDLYLDQSRFDESEAAFRQALTVDPHSSLAASGLGNCLNRAGKLQEAQDLLAAARQHDTTSHGLTYNLAVVTERLGDTATAKALYQKAIALDPEHSMSWNNLGSLLEKSGKPKEAIPYIAKAHELDPENGEATFNLGALLLTQGKAEEAVPLLAQAVRAMPELPQGPVLLARALGASGRTEDALGIWRQLAETQVGAWLEIAALEVKRGDEAAALRALRAGAKVGGARFEEAAGRHPALAPLAAKL